MAVFDGERGHENEYFESGDGAYLGNAYFRCDANSLHQPPIPIPRTTLKYNPALFS